MKMISRWAGWAASLGLMLAVCGCATAYQPEGLTGGFAEIPMGGDEWIIRFSGNGYTNNETVQSYWLYHCADFTLSKGYAGFQIVTPVTLAALPGAEERPQIIKARGTTGGGHMVYHGGYVGGGVMVYRPSMAATIRMLKAPITPFPEHHLFDAASLKAQLATAVTGEKCDGNVCPHVHSYLYSPQPKTPA